MLKRRRRLKDVEQAIDKVNRKSDEDFVHDYLIPCIGTWTHPKTETVYILSLSQSRNTSDADLEACFSLIEETSRQDYERSSHGWDPQAKRKEMRDRDLRYIIVKDPSSPECPVRGFTSLMPTLEEGQPVLYCYEIHLRPELRGTGLASLLIGFHQTVARNIEVVEKNMLTVFTCNQRAMDFYHRCGFTRDDISPKERRLRNGVVKRPDYEILSKRVDRRTDVGKANIASGNGAAGKGGQEEGSSPEVRPTKVVKLDNDEVAEGGQMAQEG